ncbi:unnamed protein product, partial [Iphiclides podalirius]
MRGLWGGFQREMDERRMGWGLELELRQRTSVAAGTWLARYLNEAHPDGARRGRGQPAWLRPSPAPRTPRPPFGRPLQPSDSPQPAPAQLSPD